MDTELQENLWQKLFCLHKMDTQSPAGSACQGLLSTHGLDFLNTATIVQ
jgi:hypothetical protein